MKLLGKIGEPQLSRKLCFVKGNCVKNCQSLVDKLLVIAGESFSEGK